MEKNKRGLKRRDFLAGSGGVAVAGALGGGRANAGDGETKGKGSSSPLSSAKAKWQHVKKNLVSERDQRVDPKTGILVIQITSYPLPHAHFTYDWPSITPDNQYVVFFGQRYACRDAPWDLFRCNTDGLGLYQLTQRGDQAEEGGYYGSPTSILSLDGKTIYAVWGKVLNGIDIETGKTEEILNLESFFPEGRSNRISFSSSGEIFVGFSGNVPGAVRVNLETGKGTAVETHGGFVGCFQAEPRILVQRGEVIWDTVTGPDGIRTIVNVGPEMGLWSTDEDGGDADFICPWMFAHMTILGKKSMLQGCGHRPHLCIWLAEVNRDPRKLVEGPHFWHSGASYDGDWIAADTLNPDEGIQLVHVPSAHYKALCFAEATQDHYNHGHPHPAMSQDGRLVVFRSDRTHIPQIYVAHITDEFRESVIAGA